jgi:hypothetical protein
VIDDLMRGEIIACCLDGEIQPDQNKLAKKVLARCIDTKLVERLKREMGFSMVPEVSR